MERNQTAGGWWEAPAAVPTSLSFFSFASLSLSPSLSISVSLCLDLSFLCSPSVSLHPSHDQDTVLCSSAASIRACVHPCACVRVDMCGRAWDGNQCANARSACWVSVCPFVPAQSRCKANETQAERLSRVQPANTHTHMHKCTTHTKKILRVSHNKHTGLIFYWRLTDFPPPQLQKC